MQIIQTDITGCYEIQPKIFTDLRGNFVKTYHEEVFLAHGLATKFAEEYYSFSRKGVLRGLHFQLPPHDHVKMVYCILGKVFDAIVDLRKGSPTYGQYAVFELSSEKANSLYLAPGIAHGFYVLSDSAIVVYKVTTVYSPEHDTGIRWNSCRIPWPDAEPLLSERDQGLQAFAEFDSSFVY